MNFAEETALKNELYRKKCFDEAVRWALSDKFIERECPFHACGKLGRWFTKTMRGLEHVNRDGKLESRSSEFIKLVFWRHLYQDCSRNCDFVLEMRYASYRDDQHNKSHILFVIDAPMRRKNIEYIVKRPINRMILNTRPQESEFYRQDDFKYPNIHRYSERSYGSKDGQNANSKRKSEG